MATFHSKSIATMFSRKDERDVLRLVNRALRAGGTTLVAVDGLIGAGKSTFAARLCELIEGATIIPADDFYRPIPEAQRALLSLKESYERYFYWESMCHDVLEPLSHGSRACYRRYDWTSDTLAEWHEVDPSEIVIIEGVYSTRRELRPYFDVTIFVDTSRKQRMSRILSRDYSDLSWIDHWMALEDWYMQHLCPLDYADLAVDGTSID